MIEIQRAVDIVRRLRSEDGCPWDRAQDHQTLRTYLLEECFEVLDVLDRSKGKPSDEALAEELGDLLLQILLHCQIAQERGAFSFEDVAHRLGNKLVHRHPHVFSSKDGAPRTPREVAALWEEKKKPRESTLSDIPTALPALQKAQKVIERVSKVGFQWPSIEGPLEKVKEEYQELMDEILLSKKQKGASGLGSSDVLDPSSQEKIQRELGDLLFSICNVSHFLNVNPESALREMLLRFSERFSFIEKRVKDTNRTLQSLSLEEFDGFWEEAKKQLG